VLPAADLANMANGQYTLRVTVTNTLDVSSTASLAFNKVAAGVAPVVAVSGSGAQSFRISEGVKLSAQLLATSVCAGKKVRHARAGRGGGGCRAP
jgi:hypothetical protein